MNPTFSHLRGHLHTEVRGQAPMDFTNYREPNLLIWMQVTFPCSGYAAPPCMDLAQENEAHTRLNGSFIWESQLPDWAGTDFHQPSLCTNVTVNVSKSP